MNGSKILTFLLSSFLLTLICCTEQDSGAEINKKAENTATQEMAQEAKKSAKKQILFFGNSLVAAYNIDQEEGFVSLIQDRIDSLGLNYSCINAGLSGETTAAGKNRIDWVMSQNSPEIFVLELGANDGLRGLDPKSTKENLLSIINTVRTKNPSIKILLAGMEAPPNMGSAYTSEFREVYQKLAEEYKLKLIPFLLNGVAGNPDLNLKDGIHPNPKGQLIVRETVWKYLKSML